MPTWEEDIIEALETLGGQASYEGLYKEIIKNRDALPETWKVIIRRTIEVSSSDSEAYAGKKDIFYSVDGIGSGVWGLRSSKIVTPGEVLTNEQLKSTYVVGNMGGMRRSHAKNCLVIVSDATKSLYDDRWEGDDVIHYTGMGKSGDQDLQHSQNKTLANSLTNGVNVYLYEVFTQNNYVFAGEVSLIGKPYQEQQVGEDGKNRQVYMFPLKLIKDGIKPLPTSDNLQSISTERVKSLKKKSREELKRRAECAPKSPPRRPAITESIIRNDAVVEYVKLLADGICELCKKSAPFIKKNGEPYLECHHIKRLADGGDDSIVNAVALCPNCHRKMHSLNKESDKHILREQIKIRDER